MVRQCGKTAKVVYFAVGLTFHVGLPFTVYDLQFSSSPALVKKKASPNPGRLFLSN
jgi:hypothetical protein